MQLLLKLGKSLMVLIFASQASWGQQTLTGVVGDSASRLLLSFATVKSGTGNKTAITDMNGGFAIQLPIDALDFTVSYTGYYSKTIVCATFTNKDTIWLVRRSNTLGEVVVIPDIGKVRRIVNKAVRNKPMHNPDLYDAYQCHMFYKMNADPLMAEMTKKTDFVVAKQGKRKLSSADSGLSMLGKNLHLIFSEAYSRRNYRQPRQLQEEIIASRFSGFKKTYFTNLVTNVLPFHIYNDYIAINGTEYLSPLTKGWQQRYAFRIEDEVVDGTDTTFILSYKPKSIGSFEGLAGMVYISSKGYAVSHFSGINRNITTGREMRFDQQYVLVEDKWFPKEMNYKLSFKRMMPGAPGFAMNGHATVSQVAYTYDSNMPFEKAYPVRMADSVDLRSVDDWARFRNDTLAFKERNTYRIMDSLFAKKKIERLMKSMGSLPIGRLTLGAVDVEPGRLAAFNQYEGTRLGLGIYTNDRISKYISVGGWAGYGFKDKAWKYGWSATVFPKGNKDNWLRLYYNDFYRNAGMVSIHPELDQNIFQNWLLLQPDRIKEYGGLAHMQRGYWQIELGAKKQGITNLYSSSFAWLGKSILRFDAQEASLGLRYAHGEKRVPLFGYYLPDNTTANRYPVVYAVLSAGKIKAEAYQTDYVKALAGIAYSRHTKRWGRDDWQIAAGAIFAKTDMPLARSFLMASNGFRRASGNIYLPGGFMTLFQNELYSDRFVSLYYLHSFDKYLWKHKFSQPFISIGHNMMYSNMRKVHRMANPGLVAAPSGYHESGLMLNQLFQLGVFNAFVISFNTGFFYHWTPKANWQQNGVLVTGVGIRF